MYFFTSDTIVKANKNIKNLDPKIGGLLCVLHCLTENIEENVSYEINGEKLRKQLSFVFDKDPKDSFEEKIVRKDLLQKIVDIILVAQKNNPSKEYLKIFYLRYVKELKQREIAEEINISQAEISKRLFEISQIVKTHF